MKDNYTPEEIQTMFPLAVSCPGEIDGSQCVSFDDGERLVMVEIKAGKILDLFWKDRKTGNYAGKSFHET